MVFDSREAIAVYRGWHELELRLDPARPLQIIDFDLVPEINDSRHFDSREEVLSRLAELRRSVEVKDETTEFIAAKLGASTFYLRCLSSPLPEFYEHVRSMLGKTPELIDDETINRQRQKVIRLLRKQGVRIRSGQPDPESLSSFLSSIEISPQQAEDVAKESARSFLAELLPILGFTGIDVHYSFERADQPDYWYAWTSGTKHELVLRFNFHKDVKWRQGDPEFLAIHEVCGHLLQAVLMANRITAGDLDPFMGITTVHDPHAFMGEGVADGLTYFFEDRLQLSDLGILAREQRALRDYMNNNAHIRVNTGGRDGQQLLENLLTHPFAVRGYSERNLENWRSDPLRRAYQYAYGISRKYHERFAARMNWKEKVAYIRYALTRYVTPRRLIAFATALYEA